MAEEAAAAAARYEPGSGFEEVKEEAMLDISPSESKEIWLIQWIRDKDLDMSGFHGKKLSLNLHKDGNIGSLESSQGKPYDLVSFAYQQPDATVFLPSGSETKAVGKISRRVCFVRRPEEMDRPRKKQKMEMGRPRRKQKKGVDRPRTKQKKGMDRPRKKQKKGMDRPRKKQKKEMDRPRKKQKNAANERWARYNKLVEEWKLAKAS